MSQNLVPNPSFESFIDFKAIQQQGWHRVQISDTPDYFNLNSTNPYNNIFDEYIGGARAKSGDGFVGIFCYRVFNERDIRNIREFIATDLESPLEKDSLYKIELSLCLDAESNVSIKHFSLLLSSNAKEYKSEYKLFLESPQVEFTFSSPDCRNKWITFSTFYKANGTEKRIILGNFRSDKTSVIWNLETIKDKGKEKKWTLNRTEKAAYYYIDDVIIEKAYINIKTQLPELSINKEVSDSLDIEKINVDSAIILKNIFFNFNQFELLPQSYLEIYKLYNFMIIHPSIRIKLEGHTDNVGSYDANLQLSIKRAEAVVRYLIELGINPSRIEFAGFSYSLPIASNETEDGRQKNRRVAFKIIEK